MDLIEGVQVTPLKIIPNTKGNILHALKAGDPSFAGFGEAYFSMILAGEIKGWKRHTRMTLNLVVPSGKIRFVLYDERAESKTKNTFWEITIGPHQYKRLTVPPMVWMGFQGADAATSLLLNIASIEHDPSEAEAKAIEEINFVWTV